MSAPSNRLQVTIAFRGGQTKEWEMGLGQFTTVLDAITSSSEGWALIEGNGVGGKGRTALAVNRAQVLYVRATGDWRDG